MQLGPWFSNSTLDALEAHELEGSRNKPTIFPPANSFRHNVISGCRPAGKLHLSIATSEGEVPQVVPFTTIGLLIPMDCCTATRVIDDVAGRRRTIRSRFKLSLLPMRIRLSLSLQIETIPQGLDFIKAPLPHEWGSGRKKEFSSESFAKLLQPADRVCHHVISGGRPAGKLNFPVA